MAEPPSRSWKPNCFYRNHEGDCAHLPTLENRQDGKGEYPNSYTLTTACWLLCVYGFCTRGFNVPRRGPYSTEEVKK